VSQKYEFIDAEYADASVRAADNAPAIMQVCRWLGVSKSGFYEWRSRPESATAKRQERLRLLIKKIFDDSDSTYGYRRIARQLARQGVVAGAELVRKLMRVLGLVPCQPRPWRPATTQQGVTGPIPDLVNRDFSAAVPGEKMVGSGSRRESHPPAPTEPCVIVSHYTALATLITRNCGTIASERTSSGIAA
jgi:putative transposase